jgi:hypothetical protein
MDIVFSSLKNNIPEWEEMLKNKCREYTIDSAEADLVFEMLDCGKDEDAVLALVLASLPKLERLRFTDMHRGYILRDTGTHTNFGRVVEIIARQARINNNPSTAKIFPATVFRTALDITVSGRFRTSLDGIHLDPFFHLPNLRSISASDIRTTDRGTQSMDVPFSDLHPRSCPATHIEILLSSIRHHDLQRLLDATIPGKLKVFKHMIDVTQFSSHDQFQRTIHDMIRGFKAHYDTLEALSITDRCKWHIENWKASKEFFALSFVSFSVLKRLDITPMFIWNYDFYEYDGDDKSVQNDPESLWKALPKTLEELRITDADGVGWDPWCLGNEKDYLTDVIREIPSYLLPALILVMANKAKAFPMLRKLEIQSLQPIWKARWGNTFDMFLSDMEAVDVCCSFIG